jgi:hypothetical protein
LLGWLGPGRLWRDFSLGEVSELAASIPDILMGRQDCGRLASKSFWMQMDWRSSRGCGLWSRARVFRGRRR